MEIFRQHGFNRAFLRIHADAIFASSGERDAQTKKETRLDFAMWLVNKAWKMSGSKPGEGGRYIYLLGEDMIKGNSLVVSLLR